MPDHKSIVGRTTRQMILENPDMPNRVLSRMLVKEYPELYRCKDNARASIRYHRGSLGEKNRKQLKNKDLMNYKLPTAEVPKETYVPYTLPKANNNILILPDIHIPYHDEKALSVAIDYGLKKKVNTVLLNGDIIDFYKESDFVSDPTKPDTDYEVDCLKKFLTELRRLFPNAYIVYKEANHEARWYRKLKKEAPQRYGMQIMSLDEVFELTKLGIFRVHERRIIKAGKLNIIHGHEYKGNAGGYVNPARTLYLKAKSNTICSHWHQISEHTEPDINENTVGTWSTGCLCSLYAEYNPKPFNKWCHGFAHVQVFDNKTFSVDNIRIIDGKIV
jgi:predicted phosphodiesterase